ncbi:hypothetical protein J2Z69_000664 [Paenibacillus shirakamiensis]|uniref:YcxB-like protein domain-containing protein n=1 Tax=Paenibacillus shirakamiensis TaxID=1265935 RepID=A0ABS4JEZ4_9BACL|nr:hypothetical protein [Paenibacillus shirakamiensis]MBP1999645.1 hypothetical protein [Paenibacillus shirakamiensis]
MKNQITKSFKFTLQFILEAKLRNVMRKSIFKYILAILLIYLGVDQIYNFSNDMLVFTLYLVSFLILIGFVIMLSGIIQYQVLKSNSCNITFTEDHIIFNYNNQSEDQVYDWNLITRVQSSKNTYYIDFNKKYIKEVAILRKNRMSEEENNTFKEWITNKKKISVN